MEETFIIGKCEDMCPMKEVKLREREKLLHRLEMGPNLLPVKEFQRSAAGKQQDSSMTIRPPDILQQTITYLFNNILSSDGSLDTYNFVENRLRSVRQDLFKQQCSGHIVLPILEPIIRFYAWATYWYSETPGFQSYLNDIQLLECLKACLRVADESNEMPSSDIEALYLLMNLGNIHPLLRSFSLPKKRRSPLLLKSEKLSLDWHMGNYVRVCGKIKELPVLLAALISAKHFPTIRRHALSTMAVAYNSRTLVVPLSLLISIGLFEDEKEAEEHCHYYGLQIRESSISFQRASFNHSIKEALFKRPEWISCKLHLALLPDLFLNGNDC
ncbi:germinal-center associated nuclear protein [Halyomorpha halys]|uniref:germinal-center associated nuclear protein n=1 Tax=Halyomorpha halys TaxID=286706 RepID=UPI0006D4EB7F|nr:germinal-center associated nuclear protein [Halyomorpha halys]XP_014278572.1 germinal-center associated nuclear protein [Halyomorpha halys]XP_014278573.1 germinal-center associated nuclear protein [Halyomorpha halys]XP_014278576.1 germinal-center associated nuclear protein [Halyomorpha halys]